MMRLSSEVPNEARAIHGRGRHRGDRIASMDTLREMCQRGVVLNHGAVHFDGPIHNAIHSYEELSRTT